LKAVLIENYVVKTW